MRQKITVAMLIVALGGAAVPACAKAAEQAPSCDEACLRIAAIVDPIIEREMTDTGIPGAAFVFVRDGRVAYQRGYGVSDVGAGTPADPDRTVWPLASITKIVTALAAMQLVDSGRVDLDTDINRYLKRIRVPGQGYGPLTLRHLLSHTSGLDELPGRQFDGKSPPDLADFLRPRLVRYRAPGQLTAYSSYGIALAGVLIEDVSGRSYAEYVEGNIFRPAGMTTARVMTKTGDERGVAKPYAVDDGKATEAPREWYVTTPSSSVAATARDMGKLLIVVLNGDRAKDGTLLSSARMRDMMRQQATNHPALPGWGLGFQLDRANALSIAEHGGDIAGFSSLLVLFPEKQAGFFIVNHGEGSDLRFKVKQALLDGLYPDPRPRLAPKPSPATAAVLREYAGRYLSSLSCHTCREEGQVFEVAANADGTLSLWGQTWVPLERDLFLRDDGKRLLGFARDRNGQIVSLTGGSWRVADRLP